MKTLIFSLLLLTAGEAAQADQARAVARVDACFDQLTDLFDLVPPTGTADPTVGILIANKNAKCLHMVDKYSEKYGKYEYPKE